MVEQRAWKCLNICSNQVLIDQMLGVELRVPKHMEMSKSSFLGEEFDDKKFKEMLDERDRTIRKLVKKIDRLQTALKRTVAAKNNSEVLHRSDEDNNCFSMLKAEVERSGQLEEIIRAMTGRINHLLEEMAQDNNLTDNTQDLRLMLEQLELQNNLSVSLDSLHPSHTSSLSISQDYIKLVDILEGAFKTYKQRTQATQRQAASLADQLAQAAKTIVQLQLTKNTEEVQQLKAEVKEERKQREKLRGLLEKTQIEKNQLINQINTIGLRDPEVKAKTKEELLQYSKQLNYRIRDLEKEKEDIIRTTNKDQKTYLKKCQDVLRQLRNFKEVSRMGKSCS